MPIRTLTIACLIVLAAVLLVSCSTTGELSQEQCQAGKWNERGYQDGMDGQDQSQLTTYAEVCAKYDVVPDSAAYMSAREEGLRRYCTPGGGFQAGQSGRAYAWVCPAATETTFLSAYEDGLLLFSAQQAEAGAYGTVNMLRGRVQNGESALAAKQGELSRADLTDDQRQTIRSEIEWIRRDISSAAVEISPAEEDLRLASDEANRVRRIMQVRYVRQDNQDRGF